YSELASGGKQFYSCWPPSSSCSSVGGWFQHKWIVYDDSLRLEREHYCINQPVPGACNLQLVPYWVGLKVLGVHPGNVADTTDKQITFYASNYAPGSPPRDSTRFGYLTTGKITCMTCDPGLEPQSGDPVSVLAVGPFHELDPGDSVQV